jgi:hypothetical protein
MNLKLWIDPPKESEDFDFLGGNGCTLERGFK